MPAVDSAQIQFAAQFEADELDIYFLQSSHGESSKLFIKVVSKRVNPGSAISKWMYGEGNIYPRWEGESNPWELLSYLGAIRNQQEKFFEQDSLYKSLIAISKKAEKASLVIQKALDLYRLSDIAIEDRSALQAILNISLKEARLVHFTDGKTFQRSENLLTLASAQEIGRKVRNSNQLTTKDLEQIKILLTRTPLEFGFWGPFKTLLKYFDPILLPKEFGKALGRLSRHSGFQEEDLLKTDKREFMPKEKFFKERASSIFNPTDWGFRSQKRQVPDQDEKGQLPYEDISWLKSIIAIPSPQTICYVSRRMRRVLQEIGKKDPGNYALIATHTLIEWDHLLDRNSFIPAYILGGRNRILNKTSRSVEMPLKQVHRCDPHPEAWNHHLELIREILDSTKTSHEIITFCVQVLRENAVPAAELVNQSKRHASLLRKAEVVLQKFKNKDQSEAFAINPNFLGREVSNRLCFSGGDSSQLNSLELPVIESFEALSSLLGIKKSELQWLTYAREKGTVDHYTRFKIPKRSGGERFISSPKPALRKAQVWVLNSILNKIHVNTAAMAFRPKLSIVDNAKLHLNSRIVVRIDLQDFFPSITFPRIRGFFESIGYNPGIATALALLCSDSNKEIIYSGSKQYYLSKGQRNLPQGACTSPALANIISRNLDNRLQRYSDKSGWIYSRYADDLIFSTKQEDASAHRLTTAVGKIVEHEGFNVNNNKTRIMRSPHRQMVTGLLVNEEVRLSRKDLRRLRAFLHRCSKKGIDTVSQEIGKDALSVAKGHIAYVQMVSPSTAEKLLQKYHWVK